VWGESGLSLLFFGEHQTKPQNDARLNGEDYRNSFYSCAVGAGDPLEKKPGDPPDKKGVSVVVSCVCFFGVIGSIQGSQGYENPGFDPG
jgi:hypothetical protein